MVRRILSEVKEYTVPSLLTPLCMILEVAMEMVEMIPSETVTPVTSAALAIKTSRMPPMLDEQSLASPERV